MKKIIKNNIKVLIAVIITLIISMSGTVYAVTQYYADQVSFTPSKENQEKGFTATNVDEALNDLYKNKKETSDIEKEITKNGKQILDKYYKNLNINVQNSTDETTNGTQLFYDENGSFGTDITLSDSYKNYKKIQIFYQTNAHGDYETGYQSVVVNVSELANQRNIIVLSGVGFDAEFTYYIVAGYSFSTQENILKFSGAMRRNMTKGGMFYGNQLGVIKVIGIK